MRFAVKYILFRTFSLPVLNFLPFQHCFNADSKESSYRFSVSWYQVYILRRNLWVLTRPLWSSTWVSDHYGPALVLGAKTTCEVPEWTMTFRG